MIDGGCRHHMFFLRYRCWTAQQLLSEQSRVPSSGKTRSSSQGLPRRPTGLRTPLTALPQPKAHQLILDHCSQLSPRLFWGGFKAVMRHQAELGCVPVDCVSSVHPHHPNPHESCCEQVSSAHRCSAQDCLFQSGVFQGGCVHCDACGFQRSGEGCE